MRTWWSSFKTATLLAVCFLLGAASGSSQTPRSVSSGQDATGSDPTQPTRAEPPQDGKLRIIAFGAHPDDCEWSEAGTAAKWAAKGHKVKFVSCTNGDIGHWRMAGGPLAQRRKAEVLKSAGILGIAETEVLDIHDGELMVTMENRRTICRLIC